MTNENWKAVPGFDGYEVSDYGRVRSLKYAKVKILRPGFKGGKGQDYPYFVLMREGVRHDKYLHHLVAETFIGPRPAGMLIAHNDGNPLNAHVSNLRFATHEENQADKKRHGTASKKLSTRLVNEIRDLLGLGTHKQKELANRYGVSVATISAINNNYVWKEA